MGEYSEGKATRNRALAVYKSGALRSVNMAVEYFTKWVEAKPLINITSEAVRKFFWQNIICRFGVPKELTVDNNKQFDS